MANGLYSHTELIGTILVNLNDALKGLLSGQYIQACSDVTQMAQKLINLRNTIDNDIKSRDQCIEDLKRELRAAGREIIEVEPKNMIEEAENNGTVH